MRENRVILVIAGSCEPVCLQRSTAKDRLLSQTNHLSVMVTSFLRYNIKMFNTLSVLFAFINKKKKLTCISLLENSPPPANVVVVLRCGGTPLWWYSVVVVLRCRCGSSSALW